MSHTPEALKYTDSHEWVRLEEDGTVTIGISDHAQYSLGDVVFVELPDIGAQLAVGDEACVVESVKAVSELYMPLGGQIVAINEQLADAPETVNSDPYCAGWFFQLQPDDSSELERLMSAKAYAAHCAEKE